MAKDDDAEIKREIERVSRQIGELTKALSALQKKLADKEVSSKALDPLKKKWKLTTDAYDSMSEASRGLGR